MGFVSLAEGIDTNTPAGKLQLHILGAIAEFERARIQERVRAGLSRAKAQGRVLGRPRVRVAPERLARCRRTEGAGGCPGTGALAVHRPAADEGGAGMTRPGTRYCGGVGGIGGVGGFGGTGRSFEL